MSEFVKKNIQRFYFLKYLPPIIIIIKMKTRIILFKRKEIKIKAFYRFDNTFSSRKIKKIKRIFLPYLFSKKEQAFDLKTDKNHLEQDKIVCDDDAVVVIINNV